MPPHPQLGHGQQPPAARPGGHSASAGLDTGTFWVNQRQMSGMGTHVACGAGVGGDYGLMHMHAPLPVLFMSVAPAASATENTGPLGPECQASFFKTMAEESLV